MWTIFVVPTRRRYMSYNPMSLLKETFFEHITLRRGPLGWNLFEHLPEITLKTKWQTLVFIVKLNSWPLYI